ncbi:MAG TPA: tetrameric acyl-CoA thioesterase [Algoriphagus sp.]|jgi:hypothetical protein|uniref:DUF4442 domain-containing protein n=1 Tax=unclassified Algoriphagus TaxID=2641541 RepID=UPI000C5FCC1D|nr:MULTISPECIES: DUF4442 domain-containing protein [unclassified Algoriphagus]MAL13175.1 tetrameric acyl-CoA thioesterase [Algoriphagus sp.]HAH35771.1 tetrameric acyl-CoA thioesterase [Algoriphagus sp.]HAS58728.1 tetrameric acyl-CoA thioesterase [Algoriphagus sp.]HCB45780.1 tetrameric acyl-CoA thioesterase [Algoriphagus sp.]HCD87793.1 tetrameric acyl-CoA thioesterase [Algoriphagus sp.]|tara:strand:- start:1371 stop:1847 length:477 start_codon:yes stop_codon:yes gene_type:complete
MNSDKKSKFEKLIKKINWYPPYLFSGIKVVDYNEEFTYFKTQLKLTWWNRNLVGTAFGGSLYAMCDPFFMFILMINLGRDYIVWDKTAFIDFKSPGKGRVFAEFRLSLAEIQRIKADVEQNGKGVFEFPCEVRSESGELVVSLVKGVYVRKKNFDSKN